MTCRRARPRVCSPADSRATGAAASAPKPPCSTIAITTYFGAFGFSPAIAANHDVSWCGGRSAVPVFPPTQTCDVGNPLNVQEAVPDVITDPSAPRM